MRHLSVLLLGAFINSVGTGLTAFALAVLAYGLQGTASAVALVQLCAFAPIIVLAPLAGALADCFDRRLMMIIGDGGSVIGLLIVLGALSAPRPRLGMVLVGILASSCLAALTEPALRASVSDLVGPEDHVRSAGLLQAASASRYLLSPLLAGLLLPVVGVRALITIDASTCLVTVMCTMVVMRAAGRTGSSESARSTDSRGSDGSGNSCGSSGSSGSDVLAGHLLAGWRTVLHRPSLRAVVGLMTLMTLTIGILQVLLKPILLPQLGATTTGRVETLAATGILAGAALVALLARARPTALLSAGTAATGLAMVLLALRAWAWWVALSGFAVFAALALCNAGAETLVRRSVEPGRQARVWGAISLITQSGYLLAYIGAGPLSDRFLEPLLAPAGPLAPSLGALLGTGTGRGAALLVALAGLGALALAPAIHRRRASLEPPAPGPSAAGGTGHPATHPATGDSTVLPARPSTAAPLEPTPC